MSNTTQQIIFSSGSVNVSGNSIQHKLQGMFDVVIESFSIKTLHLGNQDITDLSNVNQYQPIPVTGIIRDDRNIPVVNVRVSFIDDNVVIDKSDTEYEGERIVSDYCITDTNGQYTVYLIPGVYTIRIDFGKNSKYFLNQIVSDGLKNQFYYTIKGLVKTKYQDVIVFTNTDERMIIGTMVDQNKKPLINAELIITQNNKVIVYLKTDKRGRYMFVLDDGIYDLRIRAEEQPVKIIKNFNFVGTNGFKQSLDQQSNLFSTDNWLLL